MTDYRRERLLFFTMIAAAFVIILVPEHGYVPIWDGRVYANCAVEAAASGISLESLRCAGHPSQGYAIFIALSQTLRLGDIGLMHLTDVLLGIVALASFRLVLAAVFPARDLARTLDLLTLACAFHPVLLSTLIQVNPDFGVYVFFFAALAALLHRQFGWAAVAGTYLCFSKETGALAYGVMVGVDTLFTAARDTGTWRARLQKLVPALAILAIPVVLFVGHVLWWNSTHAASAIWKHNWQKGPLDGFNFFDLSEPIFLSYAAGLFILGFGWVITAIIGTDALIGLGRMARRLPSRVMRGEDPRALAAVTTMTVLLTYLLTSFRTWSNLRYFALLYPLFLIVAFAALLRLGVPPRVRAAIVGGIVALMLVASYRSVDPLSRLVYGTFDAGEKSMYRMASITGEFGGPGRDQLVYNLEFTGYHHVQEQFFRSLKPTARAVIATPRLVRWNIWSQLDPLTYRRTMKRDDVLVPRYADEVDVAAQVGTIPELWFLEFSNHPDKDTAMGTLDRLYREDRIVSVRARGHVLKAHHLVRRDTPVVP